MPNVLVLYCHPDTQASRLNRKLREAIEPIAGVTVHDLYAAYPHGFVDVEHEQALLIAHDTIVMQFPIYWYSTPPLLKAWQDDVLAHGFAYGADGDKLAGKSLFLAVTAGGGPDDYRAAAGQFSLAELLRPLEATACLCQMVHRGIWHLGPSETQTRESMARHADEYRGRIEAMTQGRMPEPFHTLDRPVHAGAAHPPLAQSPLPGMEEGPPARGRRRRGRERA